MVNAFHYLRGGVERTCFDESRWLARSGHEVAHFAIRDPRNLESPTAAHFAPHADFGEGAPALRQMVQLPRVVWSRPAARAMKRLLSSFHPDVAHVHAPSRYLTPSVLRPLERSGVPVVMTLHDFKPWCTNRNLFAHGAPCERCKGGAHWHAFTTGCVQRSGLKSLVGMVEAYAHDAVGAYRAVRLWIAPSQFVADKVMELGLDPKRVRVLRHGVERGNDTRAQTAAGEPSAGVGAAVGGATLGGGLIPGRAFVLFAGRLSVEKGVRLLPELAAGLGEVWLLVAGDGPERAHLEAAAKLEPKLRLIGHRGDADLAALHARAAVVVIPSLFYETFCYAAAEALLDERPVVASRIGAVPELIEHEVSGLLVPPGDVAALAEATGRALGDPDAARWAAAGRERVLQIADPARHVEGLTAIYREAMEAGAAAPAGERVQEHVR